MPDSYPLSWPAGWRRTMPGTRQDGRFHVKRTVSSYGSNGSSQQSKKLTIAQARERVTEALRMLGIDARQTIISTNLAVRLDGLPKSGQRAPQDPGAAVYWKTPKDSTHKVMAVDQYQKVEDNLAAIAATLEAMRAIERHGGAMILERAFTGFAQLPSPNDWRHVLGFEDTPTFTEARARFRELARTRHPDAGGSEQAMGELNRAIDDATRELKEDG